ncbi:MAG: HAMP domain-containing protein, partial [Chloroflexi bacterium]|nr:HAMP domain-containing protein [Chloroflexota bacterium]
VWGAATLELDATVADTVLNHASFAAGSSRVDGVSGYGVYAPLVDVSGRVIGMYGIAQPVQDVIAARDSALRLFAGVALVFVLAVLLEAYLLARRITTPLAALTQATRALSDGAPSAPLEISGDDEIAILARSFSAMRLRLAEARDALVREKDRYRDFLAILPHEFKTPLSAAVASLELLETDPDQVSPEQAVLLSSIRRSVVRLQSLVNNLLDGASLQSGQFQVHAEPHDLASIAEQARTFLQPLLDQKHQAVHFSTPETLPRVLADPRRIEQVVINLLSNANKHGPPGEPICIEMAARDGFVRVAVADRGAGISAQDQARLFERFARTGREGVGLGLAIVKDIVELHRGQVGIESAPGQGTTVWFTLPIASE